MIPASLHRLDGWSCFYCSRNRSPLQSRRPPGAFIAAAATWKRQPGRRGQAPQSGLRAADRPAVAYHPVEIAPMLPGNEAEKSRSIFTGSHVRSAPAAGETRPTWTSTAIPSFLWKALLKTMLAVFRATPEASRLVHGRRDLAPEVVEDFTGRSADVPALCGKSRSSGCRFPERPDRLRRKPGRRDIS